MTESKRVDYGEYTLDMLIPNPDNPRKHGEDDPFILELAESLKIHQIHPVACRPHPSMASRLQIVAGHGRYVAAKVAGLETLRCEVYEWTDDEAFLVILEENRQRKDLSPFEECNICCAALDRFDLETTAAKLGHSEKWVRRRASLKNLTPEWQVDLRMNSIFSEWTVGHYEMIAKLPQDQQEKVLDHMKSYGDPGNLTIAGLREDLRDEVKPMADAIWPLDVIVGNIEPCADCDRRSSCNPYLPNLLEDASENAGDECLDVDCFEEKYVATLNDKLVEFRAAESKPLIVLDVDYRYRNQLNVTGLTTINGFSCKECTQDEVDEKKAYRAYFLPDMRDGFVTVPHHEEKRVSAAMKPPASDGDVSDPTAPQKTPQERWAELDQRRMAKAVNFLIGELKDQEPDLANFIEKGKSEDPDHCLFELVCMFLLHWQKRPTNVKSWTDNDASYDDLRTAVLGAVRSEVASGLGFDVIANARPDDAKWACEVLGIDWQTFVDAGVEACPEPKNMPERPEAETED